MCLHAMYIDPIDYQDYYDYHGNITIEIIRADHHAGSVSWRSGFNFYIESESTHPAKVETIDTCRNPAYEQRTETANR